MSSSDSTEQSKDCLDTPDTFAASILSYHLTACRSTRVPSAFRLFRRILGRSCRFYISPLILDYWIFALPWTALFFVIVYICRTV